MEKNYSAIELEALAIWWSITQKFRTYLGQSKSSEGGTLFPQAEV